MTREVPSGVLRDPSRNLDATPCFRVRIVRSGCARANLQYSLLSSRIRKSVNRCTLPPASAGGRCRRSRVCVFKSSIGLSTLHVVSSRARRDRRGLGPELGPGWAPRTGLGRPLPFSALVCLAFGMSLMTVPSRDRVRIRAMHLVDCSFSRRGAGRGDAMLRP